LKWAFYNILSGHADLIKGTAEIGMPYPGLRTGRADFLIVFVIHANMQARAM